MRSEGPPVVPGLGPLRPARLTPPTRHTILRGLLVFRWLAGGWAIGVFAYEVWDRNVRGSGRGTVVHPEVGLALCVLLAVTIIGLTLAYRRQPDLLVRPPAILAEMVVVVALYLADVWVYGDATHPQALPTVYPVALIATVALAGGGPAAVATGIGFGVARYVGWIPFDDGPWSLVRISSLVLMSVAGWVAYYLFTRLEHAETEIGGFRAREELARTMHDGVLQTLAVIQRRSDDAELIALARNQERELREFLFGRPTVPVDEDLGRLIRAAARRAEELFGFTVQVVLAPDLEEPPAPARTALAGAVTEALNNAGKHSGAATVTIYAEPDDTDGRPGGPTNGRPGVFVSVKDNGCGFDPPVRGSGSGPGHDGSGQGLRRSIMERMDAVGGRAEVASRPGRGTEVRLWVKTPGA
ncbi:MAG: sensor histidine kinase [Acidimicrobiales bacterium]